jgi:hypothetical protein
MNNVQELYSKKFQTIEENYERICGKISEFYTKQRITIEDEKTASLSRYSFDMFQQNPDAYNAAINAVYKVYGEKLQKHIDEHNAEMKRISIIHEYNKKQLVDSYDRAYKEYERANAHLNNASSEKFKLMTQTLLNAVNPTSIRISTISTAR